MKKVLKKSIPLLMAVIVLFQTVYTSVETAKASALPEVIYYTYWDLISSLYGVCGYDTKIDESVINTHSVTGKQAWDNFVTFVENSAKVNYKFLGDGASKLFSELENLVNTATEKGISISQDLYDMLKDTFGYQVKTTISSDYCEQIVSYEQQRSLIASVCGTSVKALPNYTFALMQYLQIVSDSSGNIFIFASVDPLVRLNDGYYTTTVGDVGRPRGIMFSAGSYEASYLIYPMKSYSFIVKNGVIVSPDVVSVQVSAGACPAEVPEVVPWRKEVTVPDEWRVIPGGGSDDDPDKKPDALPVVIPIKPSPGKDPDSTEDPSTETPEDPDKKDDPDKKKDPVVNPIINPDTGNVVDPNTGWDIDPSTGMLINPNTGELVNPDTSNTVSNASKFGDITKLFPFCIPFDLVKLIKGMSAEKAPPVFHFEHKFKGINYTFVVDVDLSDYDKYIKVFRFGLQVIFVITLMFLTVKFSKLFS